MTLCGRAGLGLDAGAAPGHAWVHAPSAAAHDFVAGVAGDFATIAGRRARGELRAVSTLLTRSNLRTLAGMPAWLAGLPWRVVVAAGPAIDGVTPRLAMAVPYALQALARAGGTIEGAPHCLLGPFRGAGRGAPRAYAPVCCGCPARARCPGVAAGYLARFGADELSPRALRDMAAGTGRAGSQDMAVGAGRADAKDMAVGTGRAGAKDMSVGAGRDGAGDMSVEAGRAGVRDMSLGAGQAGAGDMFAGTGALAWRDAGGEPAGAGAGAG